MVWNLVIRVRLLLIALLMFTVVMPVVAHPVVHAQDEESQDDTSDDGSMGEDFSYEEEPAYGEDFDDEEEPTYDDAQLADEGTPDDIVDEADLSWLPNTPYRPLDFSPFEEALAKITPERMVELQGMIVEADVQQLQQLMEAGKLSSQELVLFFIDRIRTYDAGQLNSVTQINPDALYLAHLRDVQRTNGESKGPLQGIPVLLKENIATDDELATTAGAIALADSLLHTMPFWYSNCEMPERSFSARPI